MTEPPEISGRGPSYYSEVPNSSTAILSLIAGILGLTMIPFIGSILAVITGVVAKNEIDRSGGTLGGYGMAQAGIILGWVGIGLGVVGFCIAGVFIVVPICLGTLGILGQEWGSMLTYMLMVF